MSETKDASLLEVIKDVHKHPLKLTREEFIEFIIKPTYIGPPEAIPYKGRGRKPKPSFNRETVITDKRIAQQYREQYSMRILTGHKTSAYIRICPIPLSVPTKSFP